MGGAYDGRLPKTDVVLSRTALNGFTKPESFLKPMDAPSPTYRFVSFQVIPSERRLLRDKLVKIAAMLHLQAPVLSTSFGGV